MDSCTNGLGNRTGTAVLSAALCAALLAAPAPAGTPPSAEDGTRPRIGLVLSGGGARGVAHAGVLEVLEELRIPIDAVAGTSMGALVGGVFAAGHDPEEIREILLSIDWAAAFKDTPPRNRLSYRRKTDEDGFLVKTSVGFRKGRITMPRGAVVGGTITHLIRSHTIQGACVQSFDDLPTPYRAVAADIVSGKKVVLDSGDLALAMRSSMSLPGILEPVRIGNHLLVDGGIVDNLPVDVARRMGVDVIIAVDISTPLAPEAELTSPLQILNQVSTMQTRATADAQIATLTDRDVLIVPDLEGISSADFEDAEEAIRRGEAAARALADRLRRYSLPPAEYERWKRRRLARIACSSRPEIDAINVENDTRLNTKVITEHLHIEPGEALDPNVLASDLRDIYGLGVFDRVDYDLAEKDGRTVLDVRVKERSWGPGYLRFGLGFESNVGREAGFDLGVRYTRTLLNRLGGEYRVDLRVGSRPLARFEFYQPLDPGLHWFFSPSATFSQDTFSLVIDGEEYFKYRSRQSVGEVDLGRLFGNWGEFRLGLFSGKAKGDLLIGVPILPHVTNESGGLQAQFNVDTLDSLAFPCRGLRLNTIVLQNLESLGADEKYTQTIVRAQGALSRGPWTLELVGLGGDSSIPHRADAPVAGFSLGGFLRLSGYLPDEFIGGRLAFGSLGLRRRLNKMAGIVSMPVYVGVTVETGNAVPLGTTLAWEELHTAGSLYLGIDTFLGPVYVAAGWGEGGRNQYYFFLGQVF